MAILKCKICGGALEIDGAQSVATCEYCGTKQTLPKLDDEHRANLYDRANHFRRNNDFDKAMSIYEQILNEDNSDAESYWSIVLCRYGIEYVEDPQTRKRVPTINRAQYTSIFDDEDYKSALQYADGYQREIYEAEANAINEIQKGILAISQKEEPFDVFICYKETDTRGRRTQDSVLATELYHELTREGFKVFFSRITLEDKLGVAYEPYIFAALNSAKVMVVIGTRSEHFNAVWVRNEWSRYLSLIKSGAKKTLIPAYRDMDPYDLPEEFSHLQAQDMSKLGFMQDLTRGIQKIAKSTPQKQQSVQKVVEESEPMPVAVNITPLLKRAFLFLEDGEFGRADDFSEQVLNQDPENAQAYLVKLMVDLKVRKQELLKNYSLPFESNKNYQKVLRFDKASLGETLKGYCTAIEDRNKKDAVYINAVNMCKSDDVNKLEAGIKMLASVGDHKASKEIISTTQEKIKRIKLKQENDRIARERLEEYLKNRRIKKIKICKKLAIFGLPTLALIIAFIIILNTVIIPTVKYNDAIDLMNDGEYISAYDALVELGNFKDSAQKAESIYDKYKMEKIKSAKIGDFVFWGTYEQDNDTSNGNEYIEWLVLDIKEGKALLISKHALDHRVYESNYNVATWENSTIRVWLNGYFFKNAFSAEEAAAISKVTVTADRNPGWSTNPGGDTYDNIFLLSITEANKYLKTDRERKCTPTDYAVERGVYKHSSYGTCRWWLRTPGQLQAYAAAVSMEGSVSKSGSPVQSTDIGIRPVMWVDIGSLK